MNNPFPKNPWLARRRKAGRLAEIDRLYGEYFSIRVQKDLKAAVAFIISEYIRNEVYYTYIGMKSSHLMVTYFGYRFHKTDQIGKRLTSIGSD